MTRSTASARWTSLDSNLEDEPRFPRPIRDVAAALVAKGLDSDLAWWLAHLDRKVWELEKRVEKLEKSDVTGD